LRFQTETSSFSEWGGARYLPYAFTEQGVAMLSGIINSKRAIENLLDENAAKHKWDNRTKIGFK